MKIREIDQYLLTFPAQDGAGVKLLRVRNRAETMNLDPFLLLDLFDSQDPSDYVKGFPLHPHRGIQTLTYLIAGEIHHKDSLGNKGYIKGGEFQWMNSGSGILHEEMPQASEYMLGFQLWINLPQKDKMSEPAYYAGTRENIPVVESDEMTVRILSGTFGEKLANHIPCNLPTEIYDIEIEPNQVIHFPVKKNHQVLVTVMVNELDVCNQAMEDKSVGSFQGGDTLQLRTGDKKARIMVFSGEKVDEPIAWGGPIVMNTTDELRQAQADLQNGTFVKHVIDIESQEDLYDE